jgi:hypothetical protein
VEMYARYYGDYNFPISDFLWGALIFVALVLSVILAARALEWLRNRKKPGGEAVVERGRTKDMLTETLVEVWHSDKQRKAIKKAGSAWEKRKSISPNRKR